jgi:aminoglycoside phosphotransferase family enzyme
LIESRITNALTFIHRHLEIFEARVGAAKVVEGHGDLRPEHICLEDKPVIIDCLEFNRNLRIVDPVSEIMFLRLECERLGAPAVGELIFRTYCERTGDDPPEDLLAFYRTYHAAVRAKVAIWHLQDHAITDVEKWIGRAEQYLEMAA